MDEGQTPKVKFRGRYLEFVEEGRWEYINRVNTNGIVCIMAVTDDDEVLFVEQYRVPIKAWAIEMPAGLVGDLGEEDLETAAQRELEEEAGYRAERFEKIFTGPPSAGLTSEMITFYRAWGLTKVGDGGGDETEQIKVHRVPVTKVDSWISSMLEEGKIVDPKVYTCLYFLK
jgi:ADP-ribose pyrophosphatase